MDQDYIYHIFQGSYQLIYLIVMMKCLQQDMLFHENYKVLLAIGRHHWNLNYFIFI